MACAGFSADNRPWLDIFQNQNQGVNDRMQLPTKRMAFALADSLLLLNASVCADDP